VGHGEGEIAGLVKKIPAFVSFLSVPQDPSTSGFFHAILLSPGSHPFVVVRPALWRVEIPREAWK
jgi:hypothetical protein